MSFDAFGLIGCGRLDTRGELRQITGLGAQFGKHRSHVRLLGLNTECLAGPQAPAQVLEATALVHVVGTFREYCKSSQPGDTCQRHDSKENAPIHMPWRLCAFAVSTLWILSASTVKTGVVKGMIAAPQRLWSSVLIKLKVMVFRGRRIPREWSNGGWKLKAKVLKGFCGVRGGP